jgi:autotransporter-associated beta strand protein
VTVLLGVSSVGSNSEDLVVQLNKAAGTTAITGDLEINGGVVRNMFNEQIANTSNLVINQGQYDANGKNETIASVTMRGGNFRSNSSAGAAGNTVTITGNFDISGADDLTGSGDGIAANSNSSINILGTLKMNGYGKGTVGGTASNMIVGGLEMTGTTLLENGAGSLIRLNGDVTTFASSNTARLGATTTAGAQVQLNGTRTFTVADGSAGIDLSVSSALTDSTSPAATGHFIKAGPGTLQFEGAGLVNAYTGTTAVNEGTLVLFKSNGVNAIPAGALTIGDGIGGANADKVVVRNSNQIADGNNVTIASSGLLDLFSFNTSEQVNSISGSGNVELGPGSTLTVSGITSTSFSGSIGGPGALTKGGFSTLTLSGPNTYSGATTISASGGTLQVSGTLGGTTSVTINSGGALVLSGASERINDAAALILAGGTFNSAGLSETFGTLNLSASSIIDFGGGSSFLFFADSSAEVWNSSARLSLWNWSGNVNVGGGTDRIHFGNGFSMGLTTSQLAQIDFYSDAGLTQYSITPAFSSNAFVGSFGEVVPVPEPTAMGVAMGLLGLIGWRERRRARASRSAGRV